MKHGKKAMAKKKIYNVMHVFKMFLHKNPEYLFYYIHLLILPLLYIRPVKKAKRTYNIPFIIKGLDNQDLRGRRLLIRTIQSQRFSSFEVNFFKELFFILFDSQNSNIFIKIGLALDDGINNRMYSHFRW